MSLLQLVIDGITLDHAPTEYRPQKFVFGSDKRNLDASLTRQKYNEKYVFTLTNVTITQIESLLRVANKHSKTLTFRDSTYIIQSISGDGSTTSFDLNRQCYTGATGKAWIDDVEKSVTFTTATNPTSSQVFINGTTGVVTTGATPTDDSDNIQIKYQPIYLITIDQDLGYLPAGVFSYTISMTEN